MLEMEGWKKAKLQFLSEVQVICFRHYETNDGLLNTAPVTGSVFFIYISLPRG